MKFVTKISAKLKITVELEAVEEKAENNIQWLKNNEMALRSYFKIPK